MSESSSVGSSSSVPTVVQTPENQIIDQISAYAQSLAGQMYSWAQGVYAQTSNITNEAVANFFNVSQSMLGLSNNLTNQYNNLFAPENAQLVADANSYASPARMAVDMGQAGATQAQAGQAALANSEEALRSYGINPADGKYASLNQAAAVQNAANVAGAENTQRNADIATGQRLRSEAVQVGATLPAAISNVNNTAIQANTGASNATLANANTGANLMSLPDKYLSTAMGVKLPPVGQTTSSTQSSSGSGKGNPSGGGGGGNGGGGGAPSGNSGAGWGMNNPNYGGPAGGGIFSPGVGNPGQDYSFNNPTTGIDPNSFTGNQDYTTPGSDPFGAGYGSSTGATSDPSGAGLFGSDFGNTFGSDTGIAGDISGFNGSSFDPTASANGGGGTAGTDVGGAMGDMGLGAYGYDASANPSQGWDGSGGTPIDTSSVPQSDPSSYGADYSGGDSSGYAQGGAIPASMSPSGGQQTDDIQAQGPGGQPLNMNANEFVIPQDVALWKGQEFFQKLIEGSRKARMGAPAKPTPMR